MQNQPAPDYVYQFRFNGKAGEYFKIWIVNILLSILTLYIYSAWAKVRSRRYFYGNTLLENSAFEYHAKGIQLLPGRLVGIVLIGLIAFGEFISIYLVAAAYIFLVLITPWAICRSTAFNARMSSYRNVRFGFTGEVGQYYKYLFLIPLALALVTGAVIAALYFGGIITRDVVPALLPVAFLVIYIGWPWMHCRLSGYSINNSKYGTALFDTDLSSARFYRIYLGGILVSLLMMLLFFAGIAGAAYLIGFGEMFNPDALPQTLQSPAGFAAIALLYIGLIAVGYFIGAYISSRLRNYQFNRTLLDRKFQISSSVRTWPLWWIDFSNLVLIVFTLGLAYPWAAVRKARYFANNTQILSQYDPHQFIADQTRNASGFGEEIGDAFDMDLAAGI